VIDKKKLDACVHCGLCLTACPTYDVTGNELDSPRGRIAIVRGLAEGKIADVAVATEHLDLCLGCRACEPACPSGVRYGAILEEGREELGKRVERSSGTRLANSLILRHGLGSRFGTKTLMRLLWLARCTGMLGFAAKRGGRMAVVARIAPHPTWRPWSAKVSRVLPATGARRGAVALVPGCVMDHAFGDVHEASARLLRRAGFDVHVPRGPLCCGALSAHVGDADGARASLDRLAKALAPHPVDAVIVNAAGCGSHLKEADWPLAATTFDLLEWLDRRGLQFDPSPIAAKFGKPSGARLVVAYQDACHLRHGQRVVDTPRRLLAKLPDVDLVPLADPERCCGSAGVYNVAQPEMADVMLRAKIEAITASKCDVLATANPGCHLQIASGLAAAGATARVEHVATLLAESL
jgi:glycolate oxidase iron-sulfur subunit